MATEVYFFLSAELFSVTASHPDVNISNMNMLLVIVFNLLFLYFKMSSSYLSKFWCTLVMSLLICYNSHSQVHITYAAWITACSRGPLPSEESSLDWSRPILQRRDWPAFTACCCGSSPSCGAPPSSTTPCTMQPTWASANCSAISLASSRTPRYAGSTASVPSEDKRTPQNQVFISAYLNAPQRRNGSSCRRAPNTSLKGFCHFKNWIKSVWEYLENQRHVPFLCNI